MLFSFCFVGGKMDEELKTILANNIFNDIKKKVYAHVYVTVDDDDMLYVHIYRGPVNFEMRYPNFSDSIATQYNLKEVYVNDVLKSFRSYINKLYFKEVK